MLPVRPNSFSPPDATPATRADYTLFPGVGQPGISPYLGAEETNAGRGASIMRPRSGRPKSTRMLRRRKIEKRWLSRGDQIAAANAKMRARDEKARAREERRQDRKSHAGKWNVPDVPLIDDAELKWRHGHWLERRTQIIAALETSGASAHALDRFRNCGAEAYVYEYTDEEGGYCIKAHFCKSRWCKPCAKTRSEMIGHNLKEKMHRGQFVHVVLTLKHRAEDLPPQVNRLYRCFKNLRNTKFWKKNVRGGAAFFQVHKCKDGMWHPHLHITAESTWLNQTILSDVWREVTGDSDNVSVSRIHNLDKVVSEVTRYASRPVDDDRVLEQSDLVELIVAMKGRHLCFTFGSWRPLKLSSPPEMEKRPREQRGSLISFLKRAAEGEEHAKAIIALVSRKINQSNAPPRENHHP